MAEHSPVKVAASFLLPTSASVFLFLQRPLSTFAATPTLQRAILSSGLVNFKGLSGSWFETDRMIEFHKGDMEKIFKARRGSSLDLERLFEYCSSNSAYFTTLRCKLEQAFEVTRVKDAHTTKSAQRDVLAMAERLKKSSILYIPNRQSNHIALDLLNDGARRLANEALSKFNDRYQTAEDKDDSESEGVPTAGLCYAMCIISKAFSWKRRVSERWYGWETRQSMHRGSYPGGDGGGELDLYLKSPVSTLPFSVVAGIFGGSSTRKLSPFLPTPQRLP